jgi:peptide/nickel transport system substrate-binding protein
VPIARIDIRIVLDEQARVEAIEDGSADVVDSMSAAAYDSVRRNDPHIRLLHLPDLFVRFFQTNLRVPGLADLNVRRAMMYGWDRESVIHGLFHDDVTLDNGMVPVALSYWYDPHVVQYPYDAARARAILDAAGYKAGRDGVRRNGKTRLAFELTLPSGSSEGAAACAEFQADMAAIGIAIAVRQLDYATFIDNSNVFRYQIAYTGWGGTTDPDMYTFLHSSQIEPVGNNGTAYSNPIVDRDVVLGLRTLVPERRRVYYDEMQVVTARTLPVLWGYADAFRFAYLPRLDPDVPNALADYLLWTDVWRWKLRP